MYKVTCFDPDNRLCFTHSGDESEIRKFILHKVQDQNFLDCANDHYVRPRDTSKVIDTINRSKPLEDVCNDFMNAFDYHLLLIDKC